MIQSRQVLMAIGGLVLAAGIWIPSVQFFFRPLGGEKGSIPGDAREMAGHQLRFWREPVLKARELERMRQSNAEWDFMGRTFLALALCEMAEADASARSEYLAVVDAIIGETLALEKEHGMHFFLMSYSRTQPYVVQPARSLFVDSEIALMLAVRRVVEEKEEFRQLLKARVRIFEERFAKSRALALESYPDECWLFDHSIALAALRLADFLDGSDHSALFRDWSAAARSRLTHAESGMLVSSYTVDGKWMDGPEGSSIWAAAHFLRLVEPALAEEQYAAARERLGRTLLGFGWSREWPLAWRNRSDIDSGAVIPVLDASAGGSGMALIGSASLQDAKFHNALRGSLNFAAFPVRSEGRLRFCASNGVGDAALLYSRTLGPIWKKVLSAPSAASAAKKEF